MAKFDKHVLTRMRVETQEAYAIWRKLEAKHMAYALENCPHENLKRSWYNEHKTWGQDTCNDCGCFIKEVFEQDEKTNHYRGPLKENDPSN